METEQKLLQQQVRNEKERLRREQREMARREKEARERRKWMERDLERERREREIMGRRTRSGSFSSSFDLPLRTGGGGSSYDRRPGIYSHPSAGLLFSGSRSRRSSFDGLGNNSSYGSSSLTTYGGNGGFHVSSRTTPPVGQRIVSSRGKVYATSNSGYRESTEEQRRILMQRLTAETRQRGGNGVIGVRVGKSNNGSVWAEGEAIVLGRY